MFIIKSAFCRIFQTAFRIALPFLPYREPIIIDSFEKIGEIFDPSIVAERTIDIFKKIPLYSLLDTIIQIL